MENIKEIQQNKEVDIKEEVGQTRYDAHKFLEVEQAYSSYLKERIQYLHNVLHSLPTNVFLAQYSREGNELDFIYSSNQMKKEYGIEDTFTMKDFMKSFEIMDDNQLKNMQFNLKNGISDSPSVANRPYIYSQNNQKSRPNMNKSQPNQSPKNQIYKITQQRKITGIYDKNQSNVNPQMNSSNFKHNYHNSSQFNSPLKRKLSNSQYIEFQNSQYINSSSLQKYKQAIPYDAISEKSVQEGQKSQKTLIKLVQVEIQEKHQQQNNQNNSSLMLSEHLNLKSDKNKENNQETTKNDNNNNGNSTVAQNQNLFTLNIPIPQDQEQLDLKQENQLLSSIKSSVPISDSVDSIENEDEVEHMYQQKNNNLLSHLRLFVPAQLHNRFRKNTLGQRPSLYSYGGSQRNSVLNFQFSLGSISQNMMLSQNLPTVIMDPPQRQSFQINRHGGLMGRSLAQQQQQQNIRGHSQSVHGLSPQKVNLNNLKNAEQRISILQHLQNQQQKHLQIEQKKKSSNQTNFMLHSTPKMGQSIIQHQQMADQLNKTNKMFKSEEEIHYNKSTNCSLLMGVYNEEKKLKIEIKYKYLDDTTVQIFIFVNQETQKQIQRARRSAYDSPVGHQSRNMYNSQYSPSSIRLLQPITQILIEKSVNQVIKQQQLQIQHISNTLKLLKPQDYNYSQLIKFHLFSLENHILNQNIFTDRYQNGGRSGFGEQINLQKFNLSQMCEEIIQIFQPILEQKKIRVLFNEKQKKFVIQDYRYVQLLFFNLLENIVNHGAFNSQATIWFHSLDENQIQISLSNKIQENKQVNMKLLRQIYDDNYYIDQYQQQTQQSKKGKKSFILNQSNNSSKAQTEIMFIPLGLKMVTEILKYIGFQKKLVFDLNTQTSEFIISATISRSISQYQQQQGREVKQRNSSAFNKLSYNTEFTNNSHKNTQTQNIFDINQANNQNLLYLDVNQNDNIKFSDVQQPKLSPFFKTHTNKSIEECLKSSSNLQKGDEDNIQEITQEQSIKSVKKLTYFNTSHTISVQKQLISGNSYADQNVNVSQSSSKSDDFKNQQNTDSFYAEIDQQPSIVPVPSFAYNKRSSNSLFNFNNENYSKQNIETQSKSRIEENENISNNRCFSPHQMTQKRQFNSLQNHNQQDQIESNYDDIAQERKSFDADLEKQQGIKPKQLSHQLIKQQKF